MTQEAGSAALAGPTPTMSADWSGFHDAARASLHHLGLLAPLDLWLLTRVDRAHQVVLVSHGAWSAALPAGTVLPWLDSWALHIVTGRAPAEAARLGDVPRSAAPTLGRWGPVRDFTGVPVLSGDGELFGTLCGFSCRADDPAVSESAPTVRLLGRLLSTILVSDHLTAKAYNELATMQDVAETDALTGLRNRRGWLDGMHREHVRQARYQAAASIVAVDLDRLKVVNDTEGHLAGDALLQRTAQVLLSACRPSDLVARAGGDEFVVLIVEAGPPELEALVARLVQRLRSAGIAASVGGATSAPGEDLIATWGRADRAMYAEKARHCAEQEP